MRTTTIVRIGVWLFTLVMASAVFVRIGAHAMPILGLILSMFGPAVAIEVFRAAYARNFTVLPSVLAALVVSYITTLPAVAFVVSLYTHANSLRLVSTVGLVVLLATALYAYLTVRESS